jgi:hypothetical protein
MPPDEGFEDKMLQQTKENTMTMIRTTVSTAFAVLVLAGSIAGCASHPEETRYRDTSARQAPIQNTAERETVERADYPATFPDRTRYQDETGQRGPNQDRLERTDSQMGVTSDSGTFDYKK